MQGRLYRSRADFVIAGVCGGLAEYLHISPLLVRVFFILLAATGGSGVLIYLLLWLIIPREDQPAVSSAYSPSFESRVGQMRDEFIEFTHRPNREAPMYIGIFLVALGIFYLLQALHIPWLSWLDQDILWPAVLILGGAVLLWRAIRGVKS